MAEQTTIPSTPAKTQTALVASAGPLAIGWPFASLDDVVVTLVGTDGVVHDQIRGVDYNITATANDDGLYPNGTMLFTAPVTGTVTRMRLTSAERLSNLALTGYLSRSALNADLNRSMMALIDLRTEMDESMRPATLRGTWATATAYYLRDLVIDGVAGAGTLNYYICIDEHTSGVWATDLAAGKWQLFINIGDLITNAGNAKIAGNNAFSGTNTHSGSETFTGPIVMTGGTPTVPTAAVGDNDTSAASTAFVQAAIGKVYIQKFTSVPTVVTVTIATPAVLSWTAHGLEIDQAFMLATSGALPTGMAAATLYYVITAGYSANSFQFSATRGGAAINTTGSQSGTHTATPHFVPHAGNVKSMLEAWGGGGGGGGTAVSGAATVSIGGCGGAGNKSSKLATAADIGTSKAVTIGAAGVAGTAGNNAGGAGGDTSVGALCIGKGGSGGAGSAGGGSTTISAGGAGGVAGTGDVSFPGMPGFNGAVSASYFTSIGGSSSVGPGGQSPIASGTGNAGSGRASGGSGGFDVAAAAARAGGAGAPGYVLITEFCNQ